MTINEAVSFLRNTLSEHTDTSKFKDPFLWALFSKGLAKVKENKLMKYGFNNPNYYHTFCIEMVEGVTHDCSCIEAGCPALVSKYRLPDYLTTNTRSTLTVSKLNGKSLSQVPNHDYYDAYKLDEAYSKAPMYYIESNKIILPKQTQPSVLKVTAVWNDILDWQGLQYCTESSTGTNCDVTQIPIGIDPGMEFEIMRYILPTLNITLQTREDNTADNNTEVK